MATPKKATPKAEVAENAPQEAPEQDVEEIIPDEPVAKGETVRATDPEIVTALGIAHATVTTKSGASFNIVPGMRIRLPLADAEEFVVQGLMKLPD